VSRHPAWNTGHSSSPVQGWKHKDACWPVLRRRGAVRGTETPPSRRSGRSGGSDLRPKILRIVGGSGVGSGRNSPNPGWGVAYASRWSSVLSPVKHGAKPLRARLLDRWLDLFWPVVASRGLPRRETCCLLQCRPVRPDGCGAAATAASSPVAESGLVSTGRPGSALFLRRTRRLLNYTARQLMPQHEIFS